MVYYRDKKTIVIMAVIMQSNPWLRLWVMISCVVIIVLNWIPPNRATTTEIKPEIHAPTEKRWAPQDSIRSHVPAIAQRLGLRTELLVDSTIVEINNDKRGAKSNYQQRCVVGRAYTIFSASEDFYVWDTIRISSKICASDWSEYHYDSTMLWKPTILKYIESLPRVPSPWGRHTSSKSPLHCPLFAKWYWYPTAHADVFPR